MPDRGAGCSRPEPRVGQSSWGVGEEGAPPAPAHSSLGGLRGALARVSRRRRGRPFPFLHTLMRSYIVTLPAWLLSAEANPSATLWECSTVAAGGHPHAHSSLGHPARLLQCWGISGGAVKWVPRAQQRNLLPSHPRPGSQAWTHPVEHALCPGAGASWLCCTECLPCPCHGLVQCVHSGAAGHTGVPGLQQEPRMSRRACRGAP